MNRVLVHRTVAGVIGASSVLLISVIASHAQTEQTFVPVAGNAIDGDKKDLSNVEGEVAAPQEKVATQEASEDQARARDLSRIPLLLRDGDLQEAARLLKAMQPQLAPDQKIRWAQLASRTALRLGDMAWLRAINQEVRLGEAGDELLILSAMRFLQGGRLEDARRSLQSVKEPHKLSEIPQRRNMQLWAKLEQLEGNVAAERVRVRRMVDYVTQWPSQNCQSCHANPKKFGEAVTTFDLKGWWMGQRYSDLLRQTGEAARVRREAETLLASEPDNSAARLRLAYALRAQGNVAAADKVLRSFDWALFPEREIKTPLRFGTFP